MIKYIRYTCLMGALALIFLAIVNHSYNLGLFSVFFFWLNNVLFSFENIKQRIIFFFFQLTFCFFLLTNPFIAYFKGETWYIVQKSEEGTVFALTAILLSLASMYIGAVLCEQYLKRTPTKNTLLLSNYKKQQLKNIQVVSFCVFIVTLVFSGVVSAEKLLFMREHTYLEYYSLFHSQLPSMVIRLAAMLKFSLCIFLATMPSKRKAIIPLGLYFLSAVPDLIIGIRNPILLNSVFILLYFAIRDCLGDKKKWIGRFEKIGLIVALPFIIVLMSVLSEVRVGRSVRVTNISKMIVHFFYEQGVSFNVLSIAYRAIPQLPQRAFRNYTFGNIIDYFYRGTLGQKLFHTTALPEGNNIINALQSNSFAHNMSYVTLKDEYINGRGWGSSYLLEVFTDYGYIGIIVFSIVLGALLIYLMMLMKKSLLCKIVTLVLLTDIYFMPRAEATGCFLFLFTIQFWVCIVVCYFIAGICVNNNYEKKGERECLNIAG